MVVTDQPPQHPEQIGPYRILQLLGEGGMGAVYEAEETGSVRRRVAVKVVRSGLNLRDVVARFEAERQALALMNHPGIAKVFQAGTTDAGQPYFSMELVRGQSITAYCDAHRLSIAERIELFIEVCRAVQHAHQKSVVHRDLKPSNVLVTETGDGRFLPKIIDFGVAKALGQQLTEHTLVTMSGTAIGTAAYMSPEQADPTSVDIDTRSDIYSLGVMLYELLIGELPIDPRVMGIHMFLTRVAAGHTSPPTPSAKLKNRHDSGAIAYTRRTDAKRLQRDLRGDLDWIVMMAMHPDRSLRYATATSLAEDLHRYLNHEPVIARPASTRYRVTKFIRRHRMGVAAAALVVASITVGAVMASIGVVRARRAERVAAAEAAAAQQVTTFLSDLFTANDPGKSRGDTLSARELLSRGASRVTRELAEQPLLQARLMLTLGSVQQKLGLSDQARPLLDSAVRGFERTLGPNDPQVGEALRVVGDVARSKGDFTLADSVYTRSLRIREAAYGPEHVNVAISLASLGTLRYRQQNFAAAESLYLRVIALDERLRPPLDPLRFRDLNGLAVVYYAQARYAEAEPLFLRVLDLQERTLGKDHYDVGGTLNNLGGFYYRLGRYDEALRYYERARPVLEKSLGLEHATVVGLQNNIGETYWKLKRLTEAEQFLRNALTAKERLLAPEDPKIATSLHALAGVLRDENRFKEADPLYRRALAIREKTAATNPRDAEETMRDYAVLCRRAGRTADAARLDARADKLKVTK